MDRLIERRARDKSPRELPHEREAIWKASEAAHVAEHREARCHLWLTYYRRFALNHARLATAADREDFRAIVEELGRPRVPADITSEVVRGPDAAYRGPREATGGGGGR